MFDAKKETRATQHDVACELHSLGLEMEKFQKALFDVGLASIGSTVGNWIERVDRAKAWTWPKGNPFDER